MNGFINSNFYFSGHNTVELAKKYGTPLYLISQDIIEEQVSRLKESFKDYPKELRIYYAGKAFTNKGMVRILDQLGVRLDTVSLGEMMTAKEAGMSFDKLILHGSNKSLRELEFALKENIDLIVIDSIEELEILNNLAKELNKRPRILIRVNPGVEAHTNDLINTSRIDSKFGISVDETEDIIQNFDNYPNLELNGFHFHIGSQITEAMPYIQALEKVIELYKLALELGINSVEELDIGGGFGIQYVKSDIEFDPIKSIKRILTIIQDFCEDNQLPVPIVSIEPGRYIIGPAGITLYEVGTVKKLDGIRTYVSVDGGMTDNPRKALYNADYEAIICNRELDNDNKTTVRVSGRACETDDLIDEIDLAGPKRGDILAVTNTGAYNYSMFSNYNRVTRPPVILLKDDKESVLVRGQTVSDLIKDDLIPDWLE